MYRRSNGAHIHRSAYHDTPPPVTERYRVERDHERADIPPPVAERYRVERIERDRERVERPAAVAAAAAPPPSNRGKRGPRGPISETSFTAKEHAGASRIPWTLTSARSHNTMYLSKAPASLSPSAPPAVVTTAPVVGSMAGPARSPSASLAPAMMLPAEFRTSAIPSVPAARYESAASSHAVPLVPSTTSTYPPPSRIRQRGDHDTRAPVPSSTGQPVRPRWTAAELGLSPDVDDTPKRPFSILADLATRWSSGTNLECRCTRPHGDAVDELVSDNEAKHAAEWCRKHVPMWIPGIPSCRYLRNERRARGGKLTAAEGFLEAAQYLLALEHIGTDEMGCGFPCAVQLERLSGIAKENLEIVFDQDPDTNSLMCVVFAATFCDFVDVRDLPLLMDRPKSSSPTPETDANDDASPSTPFLYIAVANWYACGVIGNDDRVFNPDLSFLPGQADLLSELKGTVHLPVHELPPLQGISLRCMAWVLLQELLSLARKIVKDKTLRLHERLAKLDELHFKWTAAINLAFTRQQTDLGRAVEADSVLQFLRVELCALDLFVADAMLIFALNRELSTDDYALLAVCANAHMRAYAKKHWQNKVDAAQSLLRGLVWLSKCKSVFPTVATLAYVLEVAKTVVEISGVSYKMRVASPPNLRTSFDAVAAWVEGMVLQKAEVYPYPLSLTRHFVKSSQQAVDSWEQWGVVRANAERMGQVVPVIGQVPLSVQAEGRNARRADAARKHRPEHRPEGVQPPPIDKAEEVVWGKEEPAPRTPLTPVPTARQTNVIASEPETEVAVKTEPQDIVDGAEGMDIDVIGEAESGPEQAEVVAPPPDRYPVP
ncbi:hypothetical protein Q8F55_006044 [Vanrija albida]|uniref:Uncharacterized protein n=1 Tax=Vanrija albida TaxID=181172 RepID=A0ABR3Q3A4_9TREE